MQALRHLRELERVAEQDQRPRRCADSERVGERHLPSLLDHDAVERRDLDALAAGRGLAGGDLLERRGAPAAWEERLTEAEQPWARGRRRQRSARNERRRERPLVGVLAAVEDELAGDVVELDDRLA